MEFNAIIFWETNSFQINKIYRCDNRFIIAMPEKN